MFESLMSDAPFALHLNRKPRRNKSNWDDRVSCVVESLEQRQLLSADVIGGTLFIDGTDGHDKIAVIAGREPGTFTVKIKGEARQFFEGVDAIEINAMDGNDHIMMWGRPTDSSGQRIGATINAGDGHDRILASRGDDTINAGDGNDKIFSRSGDDTIDAGAGNDTVFSGSGDDTILAGDGNDRVFAGRGNDVIIAGAGDDFVIGGWGSDFIDISEGNNRTYCNTSNDTIKTEPDPPVDTDDHGDTAATATSIAFDAAGEATLSGVIDSDDDIDVFSFTIDSDMEIIVAMDVASTGSPVAVLNDSSGTPLRSTADGFGGLFITNLTAGSYTFAVTGLNGGAFNVFVNLNPLA